MYHTFSYEELLHLYRKKYRAMLVFVAVRLEAFLYVYKFSKTNVIMRYMTNLSETGTVR